MLYLILLYTPHWSQNLAVFVFVSEGYFSVTPNGELIVQKSLPRELLYGTGNTELEVKISDRGTPPLSTGVTVIVTVDSKCIDCIYKHTLKTFLCRVYKLTCIP